MIEYIDALFSFVYCLVEGGEKHMFIQAELDDGPFTDKVEVGRDAQKLGIEDKSKEVQ